MPTLAAKMLVGALRSALSAKLADQKLDRGGRLDAGLAQDQGVSPDAVALDGKTRTILVVEAPGNHNLELASRNLEGVKVVAPGALQPYDLLRHERLMLSKETALRWAVRRRNGRGPR
jgi:large subunit ribosomal protein L4